MSPSSGTFLPDERLVDLQPRFETRVGEPYPRRLNYVPGRALTAAALDLEQRSWDRKSMLLTRALNPGILAGLEVELLADAPEAAAIRVAAGQGLTDLGQDVILHRSLTARIADIPASEPLLEAGPHPVGLVGFFLKPVRAITANAVAPDDPCPVDLEAYPYADLVTQDAVHLVWARLDQADPVERPDEATLLRPVPPAAGGAPAVLGRLSSTLTRIPANPALGRATPVLVPTSVRRNVVARRLIARQMEAARRDDPPDWARHGLPVAAAEITATGHVVLLDRFALARMGGALRRAAPPMPIGLNETLRRAGFDQFLDHLQALRAEGAALAPATAYFRYLPPVGVLPATEFDSAALSCAFFPSHFVVEAAPIQLAQLESLLATRAGLAEYDLAQPDYVQILVPVPDALFDPQLLLTAEVSGAFQEAVTEAELRAAQAGQELARLDAVQAVLVGVADIAAVRPGTHTAPPAGTEAADLASKARAILSGASDAAAAVPLSPSEAALISVDAFDEAIAALNAGQAAQTSFQGLKPLTEALAARIDKGNDVADMGFLRLQSDIFRVRKQLVGETDATRLSTSPVLANLALTTTSLESSKIFGDQIAQKPQPGTQFRYTTAVAQTSTTGGTGGSGGGSGGFGVNLASLSVMANVTSQPWFSTALSGSFASVVPAETRILPEFSPAIVSSFGQSIATLTPAIQQPALAVKLDLASFGLSSVTDSVSKSIVNARDVAWQGLVYGKASPVRTATVAERLRPSPAQEAKNAAVATKAEILRGLQDLGLNLGGLPLPVSASRVTLIPLADRDAQIASLRAAGGATNTAVADILALPEAMPLDSGFVVLSDRHLLTFTATRHRLADDAGTPNAANRAIYDAMQGVARALYAKRIGLDETTLPGLILSDRLDPDPGDADEGAFFAAAVDALEAAISMLRLFEGRVQAYDACLGQLRQALLDAIDLSETWRGRRDAVSAEIAEADHDRGVALALLAEETARIADLNTRRRDTLKKHVDIVAFARPMTVNRLKSAPGLQLYRPLSEVLPPCLDSDAALPDEIEEILAMLRDVPLKWFPDLAKDLGDLNRPEDFLIAWQAGLDRAALWMGRYSEAQPATSATATQRNVAGKATTGVYLALAGVYAQRKSMLATKLTRRIDSLQGASWSALHDRAGDELSIADLAASGRAGRRLAARGARLIDQIGAVAGCYQSGLRQVPATIRLQWAETLSSFDDAVDLMDPSAATGWTGIPFSQRRELEMMHRWLFAQIDTRHAPAQALISTLVRICLLLSSHAPVSALIEGAAAETKDLTPGDSFLVDVSVGQPRVGLIATIGSGATLSRGVIEDVVGTRARVRLTQTAQTRLPLAQQQKVVFSAPVGVKLLGTPG